MKKTLTLMALLGATALTGTANETLWINGITPDDPSTYYAFTKSGYYDAPMCWAIASSCALAWWQDRVEENGALIMPADQPTGSAVWETLRSFMLSKGGQPGRALQFWLSGDTQYSNDSQWLTDEGFAHKEKGGFFPRLAGTHYSFSYSAAIPDGCMVASVDSRGYSFDHTYEAASQQVADLIRQGYAGTFSTGSHAMAFYGVDLDESGNIVRLYYDDNNYYSDNATYVGELPHTAWVGQGTLRPAAEGETEERYSMTSSVGYGGEISSFAMIRTQGIQFTDYDVVVSDTKDDTVFSHYCNLIVDGGRDFELKYDLRDADLEGSPVDTAVKDAATGEKWTTGDVFLNNGHLTLVDGQKKTDGGGSAAEGTIVFGADAGVQRTLTVNRTGTIAAEISINAASGNTLEVTAGNTAAFGKLTGEGNLDKTGSGTAEVTGEVTLKGSIAVQEGRFVLGSSAELSKDTVLTVGAAGSVESKADAAVLLTISSGTHTNDGTMTLETTVAGGTLKGSGSFAKVTVEDGGTLIVGNSPGHQEYTDMLTVSGGDLVFCVDGLETASNGTATGWGSDTYSVIHMQDHVFNYESGQIFIDLSGAAAEALTLGTELTLVDGMAATLTEAQLAALAANTAFRLTAEDGAAVTFNAGNLVLPNFIYGMSGSSLVLTIVPEPATTTLSLLALAGLCARRRR